MLQVKTSNGQNVTNTQGFITVNYVLEYSRESYIDDYGEDEYTYIQTRSGIDSQLDVLCKYIYADGEDCISSEFFVVYTNKEFHLIIWEWEGANVIKLGYKSISEVHNLVFSLMKNVDRIYEEFKVN